MSKAPAQRLSCRALVRPQLPVHQTEGENRMEPEISDRLAAVLDQVEAATKLIAETIITADDLHNIIKETQLPFME